QLAAVIGTFQFVCRTAGVEIIDVRLVFLGGGGDAGFVQISGGAQVVTAFQIGVGQGQFPVGPGGAPVPADALAQGGGEQSAQCALMGVDGVDHAPQFFPGLYRVASTFEEGCLLQQVSLGGRHAVLFQ